MEQNGIKPAMAFETMYQHLWITQNQSDQENLRVERQGGNSWYNRFNFNWKTNENLYFHFSGGLTYTENLLIENKDSLNYKGIFLGQTVNPDVSINIDYIVHFVYL